MLVDEFQDTNLMQYRLVRALVARRRATCAWSATTTSPIYRWRGADVRLIRSFRRDFPDAYGGEARAELPLEPATSCGRRWV